MRNNVALIESVDLRVASLPLAVPYWSMITTLHSFETLIAEVRTNEGKAGFGEAVIVTGYTHETLDGGWKFCTEHGQRLVGRSVADAIDLLAARRPEHAHAVACLVSALEMASGHPALTPQPQPRVFPLLAPVHSKDLGEIPSEIEGLLAAGFRTLKVKLGESVAADLARVSAIQRAVGERALLRLDANQGFSEPDAVRFAASLDPAGIELLEQPCAADDWDAAVRVREVSTVPMMLDESIRGDAEIEHAAHLRAASYIKLKLVKSGGVEFLRQGLRRVGTLGMRAVLGNGVATEIGCWMEACAAGGLVDTAGEMNGYLKPRARLLTEPLPFDNGALVIPAGFAPQMNYDVLEWATRRRECIAARTVVAGY